VRRVNLIGIGAGDPDDITVKAVRALNGSDVLFFPAKGEEAADLLGYRYEICRRYVESRRPRIVEIPDTKRRVEGSGYRESVELWYERRVGAWEKALHEHLGPDQVGAFLLWGEPLLYDGTLRVLEAVTERGRIEFEINVFPGISAVQSLAARHRITINQVGGSVLITTGRKLADGWASGCDDAVVMLDPECSFRAIDDRSTRIYWGAYLGTPNEILVAGTLDERAEEIVELRAEARARHGWIFDSYLLRRAGSS
jgi:precorrin-6A synthase